MKRSALGFTLLEVIVALAILSIVLAAAVKGIGGYVSNATYLRDRTLAHWVAMNQVAVNQLLKEWPAVGVREGTEVQGRIEWSWRTVVSTTPDPDVHRLDVEVRSHPNDLDPIAISVAFLGHVH